MRLVLGRVGCSHALPKDIAWRRLREPDDELLMALAIPIGASLCVAVLVLWILVTPWTALSVDEWMLLVAFALVTPMHETMHAAAFPRSPGRRCVMFEYSASRLVLRAGYDGAVSRNRLLWVLGAPLLVVSVLPVAVSGALGGASGSIVLLTLLNALVSGADVLAILLVLAQVPEASQTRVEEASVMWKPHLGFE